MAKMIVLAGVAEGTEFTLREGLVTLGRDPDSTFVLEAGEFIDRTHVSFHEENTRWYVRDEGSTYGTFVNRRRVREQGLADGDVVELGLGGPQLRFEAEAEERAHNTADTAGRLKQLYEAEAARRAEEEAREPLEGAGKIAVPVGARTLAFAIGVVALVVVGAMWALGRGAEESAGTVAVQDPAVAPGGPLYPFDRAARAYVQNLPRLRGDAERLGGVGGRAITPEVAEELAAVLQGASASVVLIQSGYRAGDRYFAGPTGTGFVIGDGRVVTSHHVAQPHLYVRDREEAPPACAFQALEGSDTEVLPEVAVWFPGVAPGLLEGGALDPATASATLRGGSVQILATAGAQDGRVFVCDSGTFTSYHKPDGLGDVAILSVQGLTAPALSLAAGPPTVGEPVVLAGFPRGMLNGGGTVALWGAFAPVTSEDGAVRFGAPVLPGTDGGPLLDSGGRVVGVAVAPGDGGGMAIGAATIRELLSGS